METNFFTQISNLNLVGRLQLLLSKNEENGLIVSVMQISAENNESKAILAPFNLRGSAADLDIHFFEKINAPIQSVSELLTNEQNFLTTLKQAQDKLAEQKEKGKDKSEKSKPLDDFAKAMKLVDELEAKGEYKNAWMKVPSATKHPEHKELIFSRQASLSAKFSPDLFSHPKPMSAEEKQAENPLYPYYSGVNNDDDNNIDQIDLIEDYENN